MILTTIYLAGRDIDDSFGRYYKWYYTDELIENKKGKKNSSL